MTPSDDTAQDFVVLPEDLPAGEAARLLEALAPAYVVVAPAGGGAGYRVGTAAELRQALAGAAPDAPLGTAAREVPEAPAVEEGEVPRPGAERYVVLRDGRLHGVSGFAGPAANGRVRRGAPQPPSAAGGVPEAASGPEARLCASLPELVPVGGAASLLVWIGAEDDDATASAAFAPDTAVPLELLVQAGDGLVVEGSGEAELDPEAGPLATVRFRLRAVREGAVRVRVLAFQHGQVLAVLTLRTRVSAGAPAGARTEAAAVLAPPPPAAPDLSVLVLERRENGQPVLEMLVHAADPALGLFHRRFGPVALALDPLAFFNGFYGEIEEEGDRGEHDPQGAARALEAKGAWLFETVVPRELREVLWKLRDRIGTVQVCSDEPWIPWELCRLTGEEDGRVVEDDFLCARFRVTRWIAGVPLRPRLSLRNLALVAPADSALAAVAAERAYFAALPGRGVGVTHVPATALGVQQALAAGTYDALHFSGHGTFRDANPDRSAILLERGERLTPEAVSGRARNLGLAAPLVFLNACEAGRAARSLVDVGGFARRFVDAGAGAFVGACWSVYDEPAGAFAAALYDALLAGETVGAAALHARLAVRAAGDPTWLAYTVYADPMAVAA